MYKKLDVIEALNFLQDHPALPTDTHSFGRVFDWYLTPVCKRGRPEGHYKIYAGDKEADEYKHLFDEDYEPSEIDEFSYVEIPYEKKFGEKWKFDHVEYGYEITFFVYRGKSYDLKASMDAANWDACCGPRGYADSMEGLILDAAEKVKKELGNFNNEHFIRDNEKANHEKHGPFLFEEITANNRKSYKAYDDPDYMSISSAQLNRRWLLHHIKLNAYFRYYWKDFVKEILYR
jgi:hypothetical protein